MMLYLRYCLLPVLFLVACQSEPILTEPTEPDSFALYGTIGPNPKYPDAGEDEEPYIVTWNNVTDTSPSGIGVYIEANSSLFLSSCRYVFAADKLDAMHLIAGGRCEDWGSVPYRIEVLSERYQFLLFDPDDDFWECLHREASDRVVGSFKVWVRENEVCPR